MLIGIIQEGEGNMVMQKRMGRIVKTVTLSRGSSLCVSEGVSYREKRGEFIQ